MAGRNWAYVSVSYRHVTIQRRVAVNDVIRMSRQKTGVDLAPVGFQPMRSAVFLLSIIALTACEQKVKTPVRPPAPPPATPKLPPTPEPGPSPNRSQTSDYFRLKDAMSISDIEFMLRTQTTEPVILQEIANRGFLVPVTPEQARGLLQVGGSARLVAAVQDARYVLTPDEVVAYQKRQQQRAQQGKPATSADPKLRQKEFEERQRSLQSR